MANKAKTAIGSVLSQLQGLSVDDVSQVSPIKKRSKTAMPAKASRTNFNLLYNEIEGEGILELPVEDCLLWKHKDRPETELGNLTALAQDIKSYGQTQPGMVRKSKDTEKYEIIFGERRWRACKIAGVPFKAVIRNVSDVDAALMQISENEQRKDLSEYAKGMSYYNLISSGVVDQASLQKHLGISKTEMSRILSFAAIPKPILNAVGDFSKVSSYVASAIRAYVNKDQKYISSIVKISSEISKGIGEPTFEKLLANEVHAKKEKPAAAVTKIVKGRTNRHLFTFAKTANETLSIRFPKDITQIIDLSLVEQTLQKLVEKQLKTVPKTKDT